MHLLNFSSTFLKACIGLIFIGAAANALAINTATSSGDWFDATNWDSSSVPMQGDGEEDVRIAAGNALSVATGNASAIRAAVRSLM